MNDWISVSEELPPCDFNVLVATKAGIVTSARRELLDYEHIRLARKNNPGSSGFTDTDENRASKGYGWFPPDNICGQDNCWLDFSDEEVTHWTHHQAAPISG